MSEASNPIDWRPFRNEIVRLYALSHTIPEDENPEVSRIEAQLAPLFDTIRQAMTDRFLAPPYRMEGDALVLSEEIRVPMEPGWQIAQSIPKTLERLAEHWKKEVLERLERDGLGTLGSAIQDLSIRSSLLSDVWLFVNVAAVRAVMRTHIAGLEAEAMRLCRKAYARPTWEHYWAAARDPSMLRDALAQGALGAGRLYDCEALSGALFHASDDLRARLRQRSPRYFEKLIQTSRNYYAFDGASPAPLFVRFVERLDKVTHRYGELPVEAALSYLFTSEQLILPYIDLCHERNAIHGRKLDWSGCWNLDWLNDVPQNVGREALSRLYEDIERRNIASNLRHQNGVRALYYEGVTLQASETEDRFYEYRSGSNIPLRTLRPLTVFKAVRGGLVPKFYFESRIGRAHGRRPDFVPFLDRVIDIAIRNDDVGMLQAVLDRRNQCSSVSLSLADIERMSALALVTGDRSKVLSLLRTHCEGHFSDAIVRSALQRQCAKNVVEELLVCSDLPPSQEFVVAGENYVYRNKTPMLEAHLARMTLQLNATRERKTASRISRRGP